MSVIAMFIIIASLSFAVGFVVGFIVGVHEANEKLKEIKKKGYE